jgi:hypothetical protein
MYHQCNAEAPSDAAVGAPPYRTLPAAVVRPLAIRHCCPPVTLLPYFKVLPCRPHSSGCGWGGGTEQPWRWRGVQVIKSSKAPHSSLS